MFYVVYDTLYYRYKGKKVLKNVALEVELWGWSCFFQPNVGGGSPKICATTREWIAFFEEQGFHFLRPTPPPVLFDQPLTTRKELSVPGYTQ